MAKYQLHRLEIDSVLTQYADYRGLFQNYHTHRVIKKEGVPSFFVAIRRHFVTHPFGGLVNIPTNFSNKLCVYYALWYNICQDKLSIKLLLN